MRQGPPANKKTWTEAEEKRLLKLAFDGMSYIAIGRELGVSSTTARVKAVKLGAPARQDYEAQREIDFDSMARKAAKAHKAFFSSINQDYSGVKPCITH